MLILPIEVVALNWCRFDALQTMGEAELVQGEDPPWLEKLTHNPVRVIQAPLDDNDAPSLLRECCCNAASGNPSADDQNIACGGHCFFTMSRKNDRGTCC